MLLPCAAVAKLKLTPPPKFVPKEYDEQVAIFAWAEYAIKRYPDLALLYATLNGVRLPIGLAVKMSKAGLKQGPPDINLDVARGGYFGLRVELKRSKGGKLDDEQKKWIGRLLEGGYYAVVAKGATDGIAIIESYVKLPPTVVIPFATEGLE